MPGKTDCEKIAWQWAEKVELQNITDVHVMEAYRINNILCSMCRRNCRGNPDCLTGLGEKNWTSNLNDNSLEVEDPNSEKRSEGNFVGLKNLGATCYVNSFLQVWFHNLRLRNAIFKWDPLVDPQEKISFNLDNFKPVSTIGSLQLLFALLQFSKRRYIDPTDFITMLGLSTTQQQDAQEFGQLFISLVEDNISYQYNPIVQNIIKEQFAGKYNYITRCHKCQNESQRNSQFYELVLSIKGHKDLFQSLSDFLKEEKLEGSNQYFCSHCQCNEDATRFIRLLYLPPVLNLQLLRFVFDRQTGYKKKLSTYFKFPEILDMSQFLGQTENTTVYEISAVLVHSGPSANSGHYVAHIRESTTEAWYKFNDENVQPMEGKKLSLAAEEMAAEDNSKNNQKCPKATKGWHLSNNAYMLSYTLKKVEKREEESPSTMETIPAHLKKAVLKDHSFFQDWIHTLSAMRDQSMANGLAKQMEIKEIYEILSPIEIQGYQFIPTSWLVNWLNNESETVLPVDNSEFLCPHEKLSPHKMDCVKRISQKAAEYIYGKFGGGPILNEFSLCKTCVKAHCHQLHMKKRINDDQKKLSSLLRVKSENDSYYIGKHSLRFWKNFVKQREGMNSEEGGVEEFEEEKILFNEDLVCEHRELKPNENVWQTISIGAWELFKQYFPNCPEFKIGSVVCPICLSEQERDKMEKEKNRETALFYKAVLPDLYHDRNRPSMAAMKLGEEFFLVPTTFVKEWRKFIKEPCRREPLTQLHNTELLCCHDGLPYCLLYQDDNEEENELFWLSSLEWELLSKMLTFDLQIKVTIVSGSDDEVPLLTSDPKVCEGCLLARLKEREDRQLNYTNARIYVRLVSKVSAHEDGQNQSDDASSQVSVEPLPPQTHPAVNQVITVDLVSPENTNMDSGKESPQLKRTRFLKHENEESSPPLVDLEAPLPPMVTMDVKPSISGTHSVVLPTGNGHMEDPPLRKSSRRKRVRGEKDIRISSTNTLKDLKIEIMKQFSVATFDQHLTLDGRLLSDNSATLASLHVTPGSVIMLKADEIGDEGIVMDEYLKVTTLETGFKGTQLSR